jgi:hypothetical protein
VSEIAQRYPLHTPQRQRDILRQIVSQVVINLEGSIVRIELKPPFNYLDGLRHKEKAVRAENVSGRKIKEPAI